MGPEPWIDCLGDIFLVVLDSRGSQVSSALRVSMESSRGTPPSISYTGSTVGVSWMEDHLPIKQVFTALVDVCMD